MQLETNKHHTLKILKPSVWAVLFFAILSIFAYFMLGRYLEVNASSAPIDKTSQRIELLESQLNGFKEVNCTNQSNSRCMSASDIEILLKEIRGEWADSQAGHGNISVGLVEQKLEAAEDYFAQVAESEE